MRKSTRAIEEFRNLQKQQVLKDTSGGTSPITNPEVDESEENEGEEEAGYSNEDDQLTRVLALRVPMDTRWMLWSRRHGGEHTPQVGNAQQSAQYAHSRSNENILHNTQTTDIFVSRFTLHRGYKTINLNNVTYKM